MNYEIKIPTIGESINEVTIGHWLVKNGDHVDEDQVICEVESEKATIELNAEKSGIITLKVQQGDTVTIGAVIAEIETDAEETQRVETEPEDTNLPEPEQQATDEIDLAKEIKISPVAANMLKETGLSANSLRGTGSEGRIRKVDVQRAIGAQEAKEKPAETKPKSKDMKPSASLSAETDSENRSERREKMSTLRKTIARRLLQAKQGTAMLTTMNEVDMSAIMDLRKKFKEKFKEKYNVNLGFMSFFSKAVGMTLTEFPVINARLEDDEIVYHNYCDISVAVSTPKGLVVPVVRNVEKLSLAQIELKVAELAEKARDNKLTIEEMTGGTFSITNGGVFGSLISTPLINSPQSAILGMHTIQERPVVRDGQVVIRPMMYIALSYDHRIIDGKESVSFLVRLKEMLEDPNQMIFYI